MTACIIGWGHTKFGRNEEKDVEALLSEAAQAALEDSGVAPEDVDAIYLGWFNGGFSQQEFGSSLVMNAVPGLRFKPSTRVENACATGSAAVHQGANLVPLDMECAAYGYGEREIPALSSSASVDGQGKLHVSISNTDPHSDLPVTIHVQGISCSSVSARVLRGETMNAHNTFGSPSVVAPRSLEGVGADQAGTISLTMPAMSVVALELS